MLDLRSMSDEEFSVLVTPSVPQAAMYVRVRVPKPGEESTPQRERKYGISEAFLDAYIEEKVIEEAVTNAIRKSKE